LTSHILGNAFCGRVLVNIIRHYQGYIYLATSQCLEQADIVGADGSSFAQHAPTVAAGDIVAQDMALGLINRDGLKPHNILPG
jgi:hypothetical protein